MSVPVSVIVPCFNEEHGIPYLLERLRAMRAKRARGWQFVFVDDGSSDETFGVLLAAARLEPWIRVVRHHENRGLGAAIRTGLEYSAGDIVCTMDSDCTYPPETLPDLVRRIHEGADIVTASVWHPETAHGDDSLRLVLSKKVSGLYRHLIGQDVYTFTCLHRAYRRDVLEDIGVRGEGFESVAQIMLEAIFRGYRVHEVPTKLETRRYGESKMRLASSVLLHGRLLVRTAIRANFSPWSSPPARNEKDHADVA